MHATSRRTRLLLWLVQKWLTLPIFSITVLAISVSTQIFNHSCSLSLPYAPIKPPRPSSVVSLSPSCFSAASLPLLCSSSAGLPSTRRLSAAAVLAVCCVLCFLAGFTLRSEDAGLRFGGGACFGFGCAGAALADADSLSRCCRSAAFLTACHDQVSSGTGKPWAQDNVAKACAWHATVDRSRRRQIVCHSKIK